MDFHFPATSGVMPFTTSNDEGITEGCSYAMIEFIYTNALFLIMWSILLFKEIFHLIP